MHIWHCLHAQMALTHRSSIKRRSLRSTCTNGIVNLHKWHWVMCAGPSVMEISTFGILNILSGIDTPVLNKKISLRTKVYKWHWVM